MRKRKLYLGMTGGFGSLSQTLPLIEALDSNKYDIYINISHGAAEVVKRLGYNYINFINTNKPNKVLPPGRDWINLDHYWARFGYLDYNYVKRLIEQRIELVEKYKIDLFLTQFCPPTEITSRILNIPLICVTQSCMHPLGKPVSWWKRNKSEYNESTKVVNKILNDYGKNSLTRMEDLNKGTITFIPSFPEFDPVSDEDVIYLGPLQWNSSSNINKINTNKFSFKNPDNPTILVYTGHLSDSGGESGSFILKNVIAATNNSYYNVIISTGLGQKINYPKNYSSNVYITDWLPINEIIKKCKLFIHHGGHGSSMASLLSGTPSLVIPTFSEREYNARQLEKLEVAKFIIPEDLSPNKLSSMIDLCLNNKELYTQASYWSKEIAERKYSGVNQAIIEIDKL